MKKEIADKWVEALRSGKYKQGTEKLRKKDTFCCLGVLCDIYDNTRWENIKEFDYFKYSNNGMFAETSHLPREVSNWAEMNRTTSSIEYNYAGIVPSLYTSLIALNDSGKSFLVIADIIEKNWKEI